MRADNPSPPDSNQAAGNGNGYIKDVDAWFDALIVEPVDLRKLRNAVKAKLIESYKNGKAART
jgi:hypothetical protein